MCPAEEFKSGTEIERAIDKQTGEASAALQILYQSVLVKRQLCVKAKLSIYQSICVPALPYSHELRAVTKIIRMWIQAAVMRFLRVVSGLRLSDKGGEAQQ